MRPAPMRRGSALILVLMMTLAIAGLSVAAIFLSSSAGLLANAYDRERTFRIAALSALEMARDSIQRFSLMDDIPGARSTPMQLYSGVRPRDASGTVISGVSVNVYAAMTGDTLGGILPTVTLVAQAYDAYGVRHVQRMDLRPESFSHFTMFVNGDVAHGPGVVGGRAHANGNWSITAPGAQLDNVFLDTLSATGTITDNGTGQGIATFVVGKQDGATRIDYPRDSTYAWMATVAGNAGLNVDLRTQNTAVAGTANSGGSRVEFVAFDANGNGRVDAAEGFFTITDFAPGYQARRAAEPVNTNNVAATRIQNPTFDPLDPVIQHQCGAFYRRRVGATSTYRWHFLPVSSHARSGFDALLLAPTAADGFPVVSAPDATAMRNVSSQQARIDATRLILRQPTSRCFPAGSPYLMPSERFTGNAQSNSNSGPNDNTPWGVANNAPTGGWYGGADTTYTQVSKTCDVPYQVGQGNPPANLRNGCAANPVTFAALRTPTSGFSGTTLSHAVMNTYFWRLSSPYNSSTNNRGVVNFLLRASDSLYVSGIVRGRITVRVAPPLAADSIFVHLPDRLEYAQDPNDPAVAPCENVLGLLARGDILVANGAPVRLYEIPTGSGSSVVLRGGGESRFTIHGFLMSLRGTVGVGGDSLDFGPTGTQLSCPEDETTLRDDSNGGCFSITGGIIMNRYKPFYRDIGARNKINTNTNNRTRNGMRYAGVWDRCSESGGRPPYFPVTTRVFVVRSLEVGVTRANTPSKVQSYLESLLGKPL